MKSQKKSGILLSYFNIFLSMVISMFFTPFLIKSLGQSEYGLYRTIQSFIGQMSIMTFGMCTLVSRNIIYFNEKNKKNEKENFLAMALGISIFLSLMVLAIGFFLYTCTDKIFGNSFINSEIVLAKKLICIFVVNISVTVLNDFFVGIIIAHEKFAIHKGLISLKLILRCTSLIILLNLNLGSIAIVTTDLILSLLLLVFNIVYSLTDLNERIKYYFFDKKSLKTSLKFSIAILLLTIITQINQNLDGFILGVMTNTKTVAIYSVALTIYTTYNSISYAISTVYGPQIIRNISSGVNNKQLTLSLIVPARIQLMFLGYILLLFILQGKEFIYLWLGNGYEMVYTISLILLIPATFFNIETIMESVLNAKLKNLARNTILLVSAFFNIVFSIFLIKKIGYLGAAIGTSISTVISLILSNVYYHKSIHLDIFLFFKGVFKNIILCIFIVLLICIIPNNLIRINNIYFNFATKVIIFSVIYFAFIYFFGMSTSEKNALKNILSKHRRRK